MQETMMGVAAAALLIFAIAEVAEYRRRNRRDVDRVGFMPWRGIALAAMAVTLLAAAMALHPA